jgi:transcriptional regulator with XRE-family HTH domain
MTQIKLAEITNLSVDSISRIERGERAPSSESIEKISNALKVRLSELFNFEGQEIAALDKTILFHEITKSITGILGPAI